MAPAQSSSHELVAALPYFRDLTADEVSFLVRDARREHYAADSVLFVQDEPCRGLYIVESGLVRIFRLSSEGREQVMRLVHAGASFNEVSVFDGGTNPASAQTVLPSTMLIIPPEAVHELVRSNPNLAEAIMSHLGKQLRNLVVLVEDLSFRHVAARIAKVLLQSSEPAEGIGAGVRSDVTLTQQELAALAGTGREVVARTLKEFARVGAIRIERKRALILDRAALERYAS